MRVCSFVFTATTLIGSLHGGKSKPPHPIRGSRNSGSRVTQGKSNEFYKTPFSKTPSKIDSHTPKANRQSLIIPDNIVTYGFF